MSTSTLTDDAAARRARNKRLAIMIALLASGFYAGFILLATTVGRG